ncbi:MAG: peptidase [Cyanobacteriota bacterium]|nr:peptidase [Cyanobacteriota bacterium]
MPRRVVLQLGAGVAAALLSGSAQAAQPCPRAEASRPLVMPAEPPAAPSAVLAPEPGTYSQQLRPTPLGWPVRDHWCVWIEPGTAQAGTAAAQREQQWRNAVEGALAEWQPLVGLSLVNDPEAAQLRIWRRRPPLQRLANGRTRASNGRAMLQLLAVQRLQSWQAEPRVEVLLGTTQGPLALQATALHELGHAFGLWGHSDQAGDAMAVQAGAVPLVRLSERDRRTLRWLLRQNGRLQPGPRPSERPTTEQ